MTAEPRPIRGWTIEATCPACGHILEHIADGRPSSTSARAVVRCTGCDRVWAAEITLIEATKDVGTRPRHRDGCDCISCQRRRVKGAA